MTERKPGDLRWVVWPGVLTLAVLLIRLWGELQGFSTVWFGNAAGGTQSPITAANPTPWPSWFGIFWLMPIAGIYFAIRLVRNGFGPEKRGRAALLSLIGLTVYVVVFEILRAVVDVGATVTWFAWGLLALCAGAWSGTVFARTAWPSLFRLTLVYGIAARVPIVLVTLALAAMDGGTHFEKLAPFAPELSTAARTFWLCLAQLGMWVPVTVLVGTLFGSLTAFVVTGETE